jgi:hypothetical protein
MFLNILLMFTAFSVSLGPDQDPERERGGGGYGVGYRFKPGTNSTKIGLTFSFAKGSITRAFWMRSLDVRFIVECVFSVIVEFFTRKVTSKTHIQNASVIDP